MELLIEILVYGLFELIAEALSTVSLQRAAQRDMRSGPWAPAMQENRRVLVAKLAIGATAGAAWGYYVNRSTDGGWPRSFWIFAAIGLLSWILGMSGASTERFAHRVDNGTLRGLITFTPKRFRDLAALSFVTAVFVALGYLVGG